MTVGEEIRQELARRIANGDRLDQVETDLIEPTALARDEKDALWLYALGCPPAARADGRRTAATTHQLREPAGVAHD